MLTEGFHTHGGSQGNSFNKNIITNTSYFPFPWSTSQRTLQTLCSEPSNKSNAWWIMQFVMTAVRKI